ncbi:hypothetical protein VIGAN_08226300 [Vigna angularis var. angularis]|uniref:Uncharacterized protein n=1 Tax=Vigna angularis var. angularis TaxID=157739 RepID=A0A0S3SRR6_PHAAN|nr:hypothetical protein VIGAN_08226300 [Vigna angularis var. angularis]
MAARQTATMKPPCAANQTQKIPSELAFEIQACSSQNCVASNQGKIAAILHHSVLAIRQFFALSICNNSFYTVFASFMNNQVYCTGWKLTEAYICLVLGLKIKTFLVSLFFFPQNLPSRKTSLLIVHHWFLLRPPRHRPVVSVPPATAPPHHRTRLPSRKTSLPAKPLCSQFTTAFCFGRHATPPPLAQPLASWFRLFFIVVTGPCLPAVATTKSTTTVVAIGPCLHFPPLPPVLLINHRRLFFSSTTDNHRRVLGFGWTLNR